MKKNYTVTFARYGFVQVEAESELDAYRKVEGYGQEDISCLMTLKQLMFRKRNKQPL